MSSFFTRPRMIDAALIGILTGIGIFLTVRLFSAPPGARIVVWSDGHRSAWFPLSGAIRRDTLAGAIGPVVVEHGNGMARILSAPCAGHICMRQGHIHQQGQRLICVPSRLIIAVENRDQEEELDAIP